MPLRRSVVPVLMTLLVIGGTPLSAACAPTAAADGGRPVAPTVPATTAPLPEVSVIDEIDAAYRRSWAVYAAAVGRVDPGGLASAFSGSALTLKQREVDRLRRAGEAIRVRVTHHPDIVLVDADTAVVTDAIENHMVRVDARTRRPLEADPDDVLTRAYTLRREGDRWTVSEAVALG